MNFKFKILIVFAHFGLLFFAGPAKPDFLNVLHVEIVEDFLRLGLGINKARLNCLRRANPRYHSNCTNESASSSDSNKPSALTQHNGNCLLFSFRNSNSEGIAERIELSPHTSRRLSENSTSDAVFVTVFKNNFQLLFLN